MPAPRQTGGKTRPFETTAPNWRAAASTRSPAARPQVPLRSGKKTASATHPSPAESVRRNVRLPTGQTPSGAFASMRLSSPAQPAASQKTLPSPARGSINLHLAPAPPPRIPSGSTPPRRAALIARDALASASDEEAATAHLIDYDDGDEDEDDYHHSTLSLSPKSLAAAKVGTKRKKRRSGGAASQKKQKFACDACGSTFTRDADMRRHRTTACKKADSVDSMVCRYCQVPFNRGDALNRHIRTKHRNIVAGA